MGRESVRQSGKLRTTVVTRRLAEFVTGLRSSCGWIV